MDNVLNRPLFRRREARNRLNDIAGVQRFEVGGPVRPQGLPSLNRMAAYQANMGLPDQPLSEREKEAEEQGSAIRSFLGDVADFGAGSISSLGVWRIWLGSRRFVARLRHSWGHVHRC